MIGPSLILAGMALGSGEFVFWPYLTYHSGYVFFWACLIGVATQFFINMEITRWTLATGESAITGFCRLSRHWAWVFLLLNIVPWVIPAWARGGAKLVWWLIWEFSNDPAAAEIPPESWIETAISIGGLVLCGVVLTAGPVIYETVERIQMLLVTAIMVLVVILAVVIVRGDAVLAMLEGAVSIGRLPPIEDSGSPEPSGGGDESPGDEPQDSASGSPPQIGLAITTLLGALAFAGAGGTLNLGQSNYTKDKGYGMGAYIGRITSPITGRKEATTEIGYCFPDTVENRVRWRRWWRNANLEHFVNFFLTCVICLVLLTLISYSIFYQADDGQRRADAGKYGNDIYFIWGEAQEIDETFGSTLLGSAKTLFLVMGIAILLTTEFGVLDATSRISSDIVRVNWLRENPTWNEGRLYFVFLWGTIAVGAAILLLGAEQELSTFFLFKLTAAMNGGVMFLYSGTLVYLNYFNLPRHIATSWWRALVMIWSVFFFGFFTVWAVWDTLVKVGA